MSVIPTTSADVPVIEDGIYNLECISARYEEQLDEHGKPAPGPKDFGRWKFVYLTHLIEGLEDDEGNPQTIRSRFNPSLYDGKGTSPNAAGLYLAATAMGIDTDKSLDTDDFPGRKCRGFIQTKAEGEWPRVTQWLKPEKAAQKAPARPVQGRQPSQNPAVVEDSVAESIALLKSLKEEMDEADFTLLRGEIMARFPETDGGSKGFYPQKIDRENNAAAMLAFIKEHVGEAVPFA